MDLDSTRGHEQAGRRPALIVSVDDWNSGPAGLVVVLPITSRDKRIPFHVRITPPEGGLPLESFTKCEDVRSIGRDRLIRRVGAVGEKTLTAVAERLRILLDL